MLFPIALKETIAHPKHKQEMHISGRGESENSKMQAHKMHLGQLQFNF